MVKMQLDCDTSSRALWVLVFLSILGLPSNFALAVEPNHWSITQPWRYDKDSSSVELAAHVDRLGCHEGASLEFPNIMHARQDVFLDGKLIASTGSGRILRSIYGAPIVNCSSLSGQTVTWRIEAFARHFAKIHSLPTISGRIAINRTESLHLLSFGSNLLIAIFLLVSTWRTIFFRQATHMSIFSLGMGFFLAFSVLGLLGFKADVLSIDKAAGISLGIAIVGFTGFLRERKFVAKWFSAGSLAICVFSIAFVIAAKDADQIQDILNLMFIPGVVSTWLALFALFRGRTGVPIETRLLSILALGSFALATSLDVAYTYGLHDWGMSLAYGITGSVFFFGLVIQTESREMHRERDHLRENLALEVKTKTESLEKALFDLKSTQAELLQSAKLASLGTLSAGIAHEINNSLNYVNGAMQPLEKLVVKSCQETDRPKIDKLLGVMKEGLSLTLEIISSLKNYSGLNQAKHNDVFIKQAVQTSLNILRNKTRGSIEVAVNVPETMKIFGSVVGINQVFMNLISNAIDAMPKGGSLKIDAREEADNAIVSITDSGCGMPADVAERIFDPFFTTKEVGKGTGLGLHIVKNEINRHKGEIDVSSEVGKGSTFTLKFPLKADEALRDAA